MRTLYVTTKTDAVNAWQPTGGASSYDSPSYAERTGRANHGVDADLLPLVRHRTPSRAASTGVERPNTPPVRERPRSRGVAGEGPRPFRARAGEAETPRERDGAWYRAGRLARLAPKQRPYLQRPSPPGRTLSTPPIGCTATSASPLWATP